MGRIKTQLIKRTCNSLFDKHKKDIKTDFEENKAIMSQISDVKSKKFRNIMAGYLTRLQKNNDDI